MDFIGNAYNIPNYQEEVDKYLSIFKLTEKRESVAKELSKGMRQKLSMTLALMISPKALLVDEPMMGLDPKSIQDTLDILVELKHEGVSVLMSTHIIDMVDDVWDSAYIMKNGEMIKHVDRGDLTEQSLKELFFELDSAGEINEKLD